MQCARRRRSGAGHRGRAERRPPRAGGRARRRRGDDPRGRRTISCGTTPADSAPTWSSTASAGPTRSGRRWSWPAGAGRSASSACADGSIDDRPGRLAAQGDHGHHRPRRTSTTSSRRPWTLLADGRVRVDTLHTSTTGLDGLGGRPRSVRRRRVDPAEGARQSQLDIGSSVRAPEVVCRTRSRSPRASSPGPSDEPRLLASRCTDCDNHMFPVQADCPRCSGASTETVELGRTGTLWTWTVQGYPAEGAALRRRRRSRRPSSPTASATSRSTARSGSSPG